MGYIAIGKVVGLSHQRIHQIVKGYRSSGTKTDRLIKERDNNQCQICFSTQKLEVHHIDCDDKNNDPKNMITFCSNCHKDLHGRAKGKAGKKFG